MSSEKLLAIDIGGTKIALGIADHASFSSSGEFQRVEKFPVPESRRPELVIPVIVDRSLQLLAREHPVAVGISIGGPLDHERGVVLNFPHLPGWKDIPLASILAEAFDSPTTLDNDANLGALAEYHWGIGKGANPFLYLTISTGIGGGVILDGKLVHGVASGGGEVGHITVQTDGPLCDCGNRGCLEQMASGTHIAERARELVRERPGEGRRLLEMVDGTIEKIRAEEVLEGYRMGDALATKAWLEAAEYLAIGLGSIIHVLSPERIVLGGGVAMAGDDLITPVRERLRDHVFYIPVDCIDLQPASLGHDSALLGAATMVALEVES